MEDQEEYWKLVDTKVIRGQAGFTDSLTRTFISRFDHGIIVRTSTRIGDYCAESLVFVPHPPDTDGPYR